MNNGVYDHKKNLASVSLFNRIAYNWPIKHDEADYDDFMAVVNKQAGLLESEIAELDKNLADGKCCRDDYADILYVAYGLAYRVNGNRQLLQKLEVCECGKDKNLTSGNIVHTLRTELSHAVTAFEDRRYNSAISSITCLINIVEIYVMNEDEETPQADIELVCAANLAKFDDNLADAELTVDAYKAKGIETEYRINTVDAVQYFINVSSKDQWIGKKDFPKDKVLKSHKWSEPVFN
ncbi:hypothetical protein [Vibrio phage BONAISHI]|nr:hypothetical protein [Vibrio phage BONAISHI]